ncbi:AAA family ATPase [Leptotrichia massiliensis]|jgi:hypothetical protein
MKIKFKNLGPIESGEIDFNDLKGINLIIGKNNTGKTYLSYLIYSYFKFIDKFNITSFAFLNNIVLNEKNIIDYDWFQKNYEEEIKIKLRKELITTFHVHNDFFRNFEIVSIDLTDEMKKFKEKDAESRILVGSKNKIKENKTIITTKKEHEIIFEIKDYFKNYEDEFKSDSFDGEIIGISRNFKEKEMKQFGLEYLFRKLLLNIFIKIYFFPAERSGAVLFYNQLLENRNNILRNLELSQDMNLLKDVSRYSEPVNEYIIRLNQLEEYENREETEIYKNLVKDIDIQNIIEGEIIIKSNQIIYKNENDVELNMGLVSSTVKTLSGFFLYLRYQAQNGDIIFIDEIELNLHPENQRKVMRLINYLSKQGLKFVISTHSPIITQEINNMIMFEKCKNKIDDQIIEEYSIDRENYGLRQEDVNVYFLNNKTIEQAEFGEDGVITETFNEVLGEIDNLYQELLFAMEEE